MGISKADYESILRRKAMAKVNPGYPSTNPKPKSNIQAGDLGEKKAKEANPQKYRLCYQSFRCRPHDPDNSVTKFTTDQLRYSGIIPDDTSEYVELQVKPDIKVSTKSEERTELTIEWLP